MEAARSHNLVIEELLLRIPGVRRDEAPALVEEVLRRVQRNLRGRSRRGDCRVAELKLRVPANVKRADLVNAIVRELTQALGGGEGHG